MLGLGIYFADVDTIFIVSEVDFTTCNNHTDIKGCCQVNKVS